MDIKKFNIPTLDGPNWGQYVIQLQAAARILNCYNVLRGEILTPPPNVTYDLVVKPTHLGVQASTADLVTYNATKPVWNKKNAQALGLMQAIVSAVVWENYTQYGVAKDMFDALETKFRKVGGALTYLQLVNMVKISFTDTMELLPQIQIIIIASHQMATVDFPKPWQPSCSVPAFLNHTN